MSPIILAAISYALEDKIKDMKELMEGTDGSYRWTAKEVEVVAAQDLVLQTLVDLKIVLGMLAEAEATLEKREKELRERLKGEM